MIYLSMWKGLVTGCERPGTMSQIVREVAQAHSVPLDVLMGRSTLKPVCAARHEAMWMIRELQRNGKAAWSYPAIGRFFGRDHTTVMHCCRRHAEGLKT